MTFTRKAAGELRQRFQEALEEELASQDIEPDRRAALDVALQQIDRAFMGTIHAFCARLLRERPLEAGIDPDFTEVTAAEARTLATRFWSLHLERLATQGDPILGELEEMGLHPIDLRSLYDEVRENPDVDLPATPIPPPDPELVEWVRTQVNGLLDEAARCMPQTEPERGFDPLQQRLKLLSYIRRFRRWEDDRVFLDALGELASREVWEYHLQAVGGGGRGGSRRPSGPSGGEPRAETGRAGATVADGVVGLPVPDRGALRPRRGARARSPSSVRRDPGLPGPPRPGGSSPS